MPQKHNSAKRIVALIGFMLVLFGQQKTYAQHTNEIRATLKEETRVINVRQKFTYVNTSPDTLNVLYFNDWAHAYSDKNTALAKRFGEEFNKSLHLAKDKERGSTTIISVVDANYQGLYWERTAGKDIIKFNLKQPLAPGASTQMFITYDVKLPPNKFTPYGYGRGNTFYLKDWYLTPVVYDKEWLLYSNTNLEDLYTDPTDTDIYLIYPPKLLLSSNFKKQNNTQFPGGQQIRLRAKQQKSCEVILTPIEKFTKHVTKYLSVITDIESARYDEISKGISIERVSKFIHNNLGEYPHGDLLVSTIDYNKSPLYGINQLPSFIRPYEEQFQFEMKFLKTALNSFLKETMYLNPRKEQWVKDALLNYLMISYVDTYYPKQKLLGKLSNLWGVRGFHLAKMDFNEQYPLLYMISARRNADQSLTTRNDSLIKFNQKIANSYKAGLGLAYLADYIGKENVDNSIKTFYNDFKLKPVKPSNLQTILEASTDKDVEWFFDEYVSTSDQIDFKIRKIIKYEDSITFTIKNKQGTNVPISLFGLKKDSVVSKYWFSDVADEKSFTISRDGADRLVLNYDQKIPEFNQRDNWKTLNGFFSSNKKLKFQFFKDAEDPYYNQVFYVPVVNFNVYDGVTPGLRFTNKSLLQRPFIFDFSPTYSFNEKSLVGFGKFSYQKYHNKTGLFVSNYALRASTFHFQTNSRYSTITPSISFGWRPENRISNKREFLSFRHVNVFRTIDESLDDLETDPDYSVFNARYTNINNNIINFSSWFVDAQHSNNFTKLAFNWEYRKLFDNNRQFNLRFFAGKFLRNKSDSDFFSFALDRPTDYLFDYNYLGRSEDSGIYSQQIIIAEGGFKSQLQNPFADDWMFTTNASFNVWRWIELYGDVGFMKNKGQRQRFVYDSGVRLNLVTDYFELYFPVHSNNGWEISQNNYEEKIRFVVTLSPKTLIRLFTRKWF
ncbi:metalloprotease [Spongiimicrobium sp. 3-5]|uniref:metalloprotease n=1 Tax=Spongiimicrobium sp. 3-5 TaxID=3332596 RepID=UPI00397EBD7B